MTSRKLKFSSSPCMHRSGRRGGPVAFWWGATLLRLSDKGTGFISNNVEQNTAVLQNWKLVNLKEAESNMEEDN